MKTLSMLAFAAVCALFAGTTSAQSLAGCTQERALGANMFNCGGIYYERLTRNGRSVFAQVEVTSPERTDELRYLEQAEEDARRLRLQAEEDARRRRQQYDAMIGSSLPYGRRGTYDRGYLNCNVIGNRNLDACVELRRLRNRELENPGNPCAAGIGTVACDRWQRGVYGTTQP